MSKYKVGDVAALFSKPKEPTTEGGKKLQSLFKEFNCHSKKKYKSEAESYQKKKAEKNVNNIEEAGGETQIQRPPKKDKKRKFAAVSSPESNIENSNKDKKRKFSDVSSSESNIENSNRKKFKETSQQVDAKVVKQKEKNPIPAEVDFPRKKKSFKNRDGNFNSKISNEFKLDESAFSDAEQETDASFKLKKKSKNIKGTSGLIKKSKQRKLASSNGCIGIQENEKTNSVDDDALLKEQIEEFINKSCQKLKKKRDANLLQIALLSHNDDSTENEGTENCEKKFYEESFENDTSDKSEIKDFVRSAKKKKKKSDSGKLIHNSQQKELEDKSDFMKLPDDEEDILRRTLFVGNLPVNITIKDLKTLFSPFGDIQDIRYRGIETDKAKIFSEDGHKLLTANNYAADSVPGFIVFNDRQSAIHALSLSGSLFKGRHITVDFALPVGAKKLYDDKRSIFLGNLPFGCKDESVWEAFSECGRIESVRIVRDKETGIGKGFGYVQFSTVQAKENALALEGLQIQERYIRIKAVESSKTAQNKNISAVPTAKKDSFKSQAIRLKKKNKGSGSRKSVKKIMKKQKTLHNKKKVASILQKTMKS